MRQEKRDEKRLNKERKLEQRRLELEIARELKKPNEDMCLSDHKVLLKKNRYITFKSEIVIYFKTCLALQCLEMCATKWSGVSTAVYRT